MGDVQTIRALEVGEYSSALGSNALAKAAVDTLAIRRYVIRKAAADAMAGDATAETLGVDIQADGYVSAIWVKTDADVAGHASNHATIDVNKRNAAGASSVSVGTLTTDTDAPGQGSLSEFVREGFTMSVVAGARDVVAGGSFNFSIAKGGTGVVMPILEIAIDVVPT